jgi:RNA polymerase sigma factor (sigma-70 family)
MSRDLETLVKKCREGDVDAWATLVSRFQSLVYSIPIKHGLNSDDAADVFQQTFQALHSHLDKIRVDATLPKWLAVTAARESLKVIRARERVLDPGDASLEQVVDTEERNAEESAVLSWQADELRSALGRMPSRCRDLLTLLYFEDLAYDEIMTRTGMPMGAIGPTRARCLEKLRKSLEDGGFFS